MRSTQPKRLSRGRRVFAERLESRMLLTAGPSGTEFWVNAIGPGAQGAPVIDSNSQGESVIVWENRATSISSAGDLLGQRYNAIGARIGPEFPIIETSFPNGYGPAVVLEDDGEMVIAWSESSLTGYDVYARRYAANGQPLTQKFVVAATGFNNFMRFAPGLAVDSRGNIAVGWTSNQVVRLSRFTADGVSLGPAVQVDTTSTAESWPQMAFDAQDNLVVTWTGFAGGWGAFARRFGSDGAPLGDEFVVGIGTGFPRSNAAIAVDSEGDFLIAWSHENGLSTYGQFFNSAAQPQGSRLTFPRDPFYRPRVAIDDTGEFVVTWTNYDTNSKGVYAQGVSAAGVPQGTPFRVNTYTTGSQSRPAVAMDADGDFMVAWESDGQDGNLAGVFAQRYSNVPDRIGAQIVSVVEPVTQRDLSDRAATAVAPSQLLVEFSELVARNGSVISATRLSNWRLLLHGVDVSHLLRSATSTTTPVTRRMPLILTLAEPLPPAEYELVALDMIRDLAGNPLDGNADGVPGGEFRMRFSVARWTAAAEQPVTTTTAFPQFKPTMASAADGSALVVWTSSLQDGNGNSVHAMRLAADGSPQGTEFRVNHITAFDQNEPSVTAVAGGNYVVAWRSGASSTYEIIARVFEASGMPVTGEIPVSERFGRYALPVVGADASGNFVVAWQRDTGTQALSTDVHFRRFSADGMALGPTTLASTTDAGQQGFPSLAVAPNSGFWVAWIESDGAGGSNIVARKFDATGQPLTGDLQVNANSIPGTAMASIVETQDGSHLSIAWQYYDAATKRSGVELQRITPDGSPLGGTVPLALHATQRLTSPKMAYNATGVWTAANDSLFDDVVGRLYTTTGTLQAAATINAFTPGDQWSPSIGSTATGFLVSWSSLGPVQNAGNVYATTLTPTMDGAPRVALAGIVVAGSQSQHDAFSIPIGSGEQLRTIPVGNADTIHVRFTEEVDVQADDLTVVGALGGQYATADFTWDSSTLEARWRLADPLRLGESITLSLDDRVVDRTGNRLDGEWVNPTSLSSTSGSLSSGNGQPGGDFVFRFHVLPGDANRDNVVDASDLAIWAAHFEASGTQRFVDGDFTGDGHVTGADYTVWADVFGSDLRDSDVPAATRSAPGLATRSVLGPPLRESNARDRSVIDTSPTTAKNITAPPRRAKVVVTDPSALDLVIALS